MENVIEVAGKEFKFVFPSLFVVREVLKLGFGGDFREKWTKIESDDKEFQTFNENWPKFVHTVIDGDSTPIEDLSKITYGEAMGIHMGFTSLAWDVRKNSSAGLNTSANSEPKTMKHEKKSHQ